MADTITYPDGGYGIMPNDAFNKYIKFQNQRRAVTGSGASPSDQQAFWSGTMDAVVKNSAQRAAQSLENRRLDADISYKNSMLGMEGRKLDQADDARKSSMMSGLAMYPMTYLMYDALGVGRRNPVTGAKEGTSIAGNIWDTVSSPSKWFTRKPQDTGVTPQNPNMASNQQSAYMNDVSVRDITGGSGELSNLNRTDLSGYNAYINNLYQPTDATVGNLISGIPNHYVPAADPTFYNYDDWTWDIGSGGSEFIP